MKNGAGVVSETPEFKFCLSKFFTKIRSILTFHGSSQMPVYACQKGVVDGSPEAVFYFITQNVR